jgi:hypothetical protein
MSVEYSSTPEALMSDPARVRYLTEHYAQLQGLRLVPLGLVFIGVAVWHGGGLRWLPGSAQGGIHSWFVVAFAAAIVAAYVIGARYRRRFGSIRLRPFAGGPWHLGVLVALGLGLALQDTFRWPLSLPLLVVGAALGYIGVVRQGLRRHYLWIAAACVLFSNISNFGLPVRTQQVMFDLLIAGGLIAAGIGDHLVLIKTLQAPDPRTHAETAV